MYSRRIFSSKICSRSLHKSTTSFYWRHKILDGINNFLGQSFIEEIFETAPNVPEKEKKKRGFGQSCVPLIALDILSPSQLVEEK